MRLEGKIGHCRRRAVKRRGDDRERRRATAMLFAREGARGLEWSTAILARARRDGGDDRGGGRQ